MNKIRMMGFIFAALLASTCAEIPTLRAQSQNTQEYKVMFRTEPSPAKGSVENTFHVSVTDSAGKSISDATVKITLVMPAMPEMGMAEMKVSLAVAWNGSDYSGKANPFRRDVECDRASAEGGSRGWVGKDAVSGEVTRHR